jgi:hypothetical protein
MSEVFWSGSTAMLVLAALVGLLRLMPLTLAWPKHPVVKESIAL